MNEKLIKFFEKYKKLFREGMSPGDSDDILLDLIGIIDELEVEKVLKFLEDS